MSTDIATAAEFHLFNWFDKNRKTLLQAAAAVALVALVVSYVFWHKGEQESDASEQLSGISGAGSAEAYLKVAADYPKTSAAPRAVLLAAGELFTAGKYPDAQAQYQRLAADYTDSPFRAQALYGLAACADAQGKADDAVTQYNDALQRYPNDAAAPLARSALGRIYESKNQLDKAAQIYQELSRTEAYGSVSLEAGIRLQALLAQHPDLAAKAAVINQLQPK